MTLLVEVLSRRVEYREREGDRNRIVFCSRFVRQAVSPSKQDIHSGSVCTANSGVRRIVYLGGLGNQDQALSAHLRSRHRLQRTPVSVTAAGKFSLTHKL
jgi:hypothetical protein